jgi:ElaB/YqjD/DUF883 family membrane-anchored ribosome-binding protein
MTVEHDTGAAPVGVPSDAQSQSGRVTDVASTEASNVASTAAGGAREVADEAGAQARAVASEAKQQLDRLITQGRNEVREQAEQRSSQAVSQLHSLSEQFGALAQGRPDSAGPLVGYLNDAQNRLRSLASRLEQRGPQGVVEDATNFARRRPGLFLAAATGVGFLVGRVVRAAGQQEGGGPTAPVGGYQPTAADPVYGGDSVGNLSPADTAGPSEPSPLPPPVSGEGIRP